MVGQVDSSPGGLRVGMKVTIKDSGHLGIGTIVTVRAGDQESFGILFRDSPVKTFYPQEIRRYVLPAGSLVKTVHGLGMVKKSIQAGGDGEFHRYEIAFGDQELDGVITRQLTEKAILAIIRLGPEKARVDELVPAQVHIVGRHLAAYYFRYCLPQDSRYQAICHGRIEAFPFQAAVIKHVLSRYPTRFLLCDEVGLGKTIEACSVLKEMFLQKIIHRAIIIVPANLVEQWNYELESKFNLKFEIYDGRKVNELRRAYPSIPNPWTIHPRIITSLHFARRDENRKLLSDVVFDFAIFDEAHHLRRYKVNKGSHRQTKAYDLGEKICGRARFVLLLTATPMQLDSFELYSLIQLVDPGLFPTFNDFVEFKEKISHYNLVLNNLDRFEKLNVFEQKYMLNMVSDIIKADDWTQDKETIRRLLLQRDPELKRQVLENIRQKHLLSRVLIRNKKKHVFGGKVPRRRTKIVLIDPSPEELEVYGAIRNYITRVYQRSLEERNAGTGFVMTVFQKMLASSHYAIRETMRRRIDKLGEINVALHTQLARLEKDPLSLPKDEYEAKKRILEKRIERIEEDIPLLNEYHAKLSNLHEDTKATALLHLMRELMEREPGAKLIVFTQFIRTLSYLKSVINRVFQGKNVEVFVFHGKLSKEEKDIQVENFKDSTCELAVLLSTEAGGEGRNFQFCHNLVNYDLPWNPMRLEQRIGRIDRIGQKHDLNIFNFALRGTIEEHVCHILSERIFAFQEIVGELEPILVDFDKDIESAILTSTNDEELGLKFKSLDNKLAGMLRELQEHRVAMQDIIMEKHAMDIMQKEEFACDVAMEYSGNLRRFIEVSALKAGYVLREIKSRPEVLEIEHVATGKTILGTFNRETALGNERLEYLNLGHETIERVITSELGDIKGVEIAVHELPGHLDIPGLQPGFSRGGNPVFVVVNSVLKSGVKNQRVLLVQAISLDSDLEPAASPGGAPGIDGRVARIDDGPFLDYLLRLANQDKDGSKCLENGVSAVDVKEFKETKKSVIEMVLQLNRKAVDGFIQEEMETWKDENEKFSREMKDRAMKLHEYKLKMMNDQVAQYTKMINELEFKGIIKEKEKARLASLERKRDEIKEQLENLKKERERELTEISSALDRMGITSHVVSVLCFIPRVEHPRGHRGSHDDDGGGKGN